MSDDKKSGDQAQQRRDRSAKARAKNVEAKEKQDAIIDGAKKGNSGRDFNFKSVDRQTGITHGAVKGVAYSLNTRTGELSGIAPKEIRDQARNIRRNNPNAASNQGFGNERQQQINKNKQDAKNLAKQKSQGLDNSSGFRNAQKSGTGTVIKNQGKFTGQLKQKNVTEIKDSAASITNEFITSGQSPAQKVTFQKNNAIPGNDQLLVSVPTKKNQSVQVDNFNSLVKAGHTGFPKPSTVKIKSKSISSTQTPSEIRLEQKQFVAQAKESGAKSLLIFNSTTNERKIVPIDQGFRAIVANPGSTISIGALAG